MNLTDRIYLTVHLALTVLVCARYPQVAHWPSYVAWNVLAIAAILLLARRQHHSPSWEFAHDWLPAIFFITVFEEVSFLSLAIRGDWQNPHLIALESALFAALPADWLHRYTALVVYRAAGLRLLQLLSTLSRSRRSAVGMAPPGALRRGLSPHDRRPQRGLRRLLCHLPVISHAQSIPQCGTLPAAHPAGPFHFLVRLIQGAAGVHGNAFPSSHIMLAFAVLVFVFRYFPRLAPWVLLCNLLMCLGAVYDGYHYAIDVVAGAVLGIVAGAIFLERKILR